MRTRTSTVHANTLNSEYSIKWIDIYFSNSIAICYLYVCIKHSNTQRKPHLTSIEMQIFTAYFLDVYAIAYSFFRSLSLSFSLEINHFSSCICRNEFDSFFCALCSVHSVTYTFLCSGFFVLGFFVNIVFTEHTQKHIQLKATLYLLLCRLAY